MYSEAGLKQSIAAPNQLAIVYSEVGFYSQASSWGWLSVHLRSIAALRSIVALGERSLFLEDPEIVRSRSF